MPAALLFFERQYLLIKCERKDFKSQIRPEELYEI